MSFMFTNKYLSLVLSCELCLLQCTYKSQMGIRKCFLCKLLNVSPWQDFLNTSSHLPHVSSVTPFQQLISPADQLGRATNTGNGLSLLFPQKQHEISTEQTDNAHLQCDVCCSWRTALDSLSWSLHMLLQHGSVDTLTECNQGRAGLLCTASLQKAAGSTAGYNKMR